MKKHSFNSSFIRPISIISGLTGIGLILLAVFWKPIELSKSSVLDETLQIFQTQVTITQDSTTTPQIDLPLPTQIPNTQAIIIPSPTPEWMVYDGIDFRDKEVDALFTMQCDQEIIYLEPFQIVPYNPELMQSGAFSNDFDFSVAWEHLGYYGLWIHSGLAYNIGALAAYPLQINLEITLKFQALPIHRILIS